MENFEKSFFISIILQKSITHTIFQHFLIRNFAKIVRRRLRASNFQNFLEDAPTILLRTRAVGLKVSYCSKMSSTSFERQSDPWAHPEQCGIAPGRE